MSEYFGIIVDNNDPLKIGRCKVKVIGLYDSLKESDLPWLQCKLPLNILQAPVALPYGTQVIVKSLDEHNQVLYVDGWIPGIDDITDIPDSPDFIRNDSTPQYVINRNNNIIDGFEPSSSYNAIYPYNRGFYGLSGHVFEYDDTSGSERINLYHKSGSYFEMTNDSQILKSSGNTYEIVSQNFIGYTGDSYNYDVGSTYTLNIDTSFEATCPMFTYNGNVYINGGLYFLHCYGYGGSGKIYIDDNIEVRQDKTLGINTISATYGGTTSINNSIYVNGNIQATGGISGGISDIRLKDKIQKIENAIEKILSLEGFIYKPNELALSIGVQNTIDVGLSAQDVQNIQPEAVDISPINSDYLTIKYEKLVPLLIEGFKEFYNEFKSFYNEQILNKVK